MGMSLLHSEISELQSYLSNLTHKNYCPMSQEGEVPTTCDCGLAHARSILCVGTCQVCGCATPCGVTRCDGLSCGESQ